MTYDEILIDKGFVKTGIKRSLLNGKTVNAWIYTNPICENNWEVANMMAQEFYKEVNDWLEREDLELRAHSSRLPSRSELCLVESLCQRYVDSIWLSTGTCRTGEHFAVDNRGILVERADCYSLCCYPLVRIYDTIC